MAALQEVKLVVFHTNLTSKDDEFLRYWINRIFWRWVVENKDRRVKLKIWIFTKEYSIKELAPVFKLLLGEPVEPISL